MKDFELEKLAVEDIKTALEYIGKTARSKSIFLGNSSKKRKTDYRYPLLTHKNPSNPKQLTESKSCH